MCTGKCSRFIAIALYPLALVSIICNIVLFFPDGDVQYAKDKHITTEVTYMGGLVGGGIMVLVPALYIHLTGSKGCCGNRCGMFLSIAFAAVGVAGGLYSLIVAGVALRNGPYCRTTLGWDAPFLNGEGKYLTEDSKRLWCLQPENIVQFHIGLFATLLATSCLQVVLCGIQMINGLFGCLCGTCMDKGTL